MSELGSAGESRRVAVFCAHFLSRDQNHVHRQVDGIPGWETRVFTWKRDCAAQFPFPEDRLVELEKPWSRELSRCWNGRILRRPWQVGTREAASITSALENSHAEALHVYFGHVAIHCLPVLQQTSLPVLVSFHGVDAAIEEGSARHRLMQRVFGAASLLLARSEELIARLEALGAPPDRLRLWRAGVPLDEWPAPPRREPVDGRWILTQACRFQDKKGIDTSLRAFARLRRRWPEARLVVAGDGPCRDHLAHLALELEIGDAIEWPGFLGGDELRALYARAHVLLHPSRTTPEGDREGVPNAMLEGMATALPVAATRHGGIPEALAGTGSVLVEEGGHGGLAEGIERWFEDPTRWRAAAAEARRAVERGYALPRQRKRLASLYAEAAARR